MQVYIVEAYRWGDRDNHHYTVGIYNSEEKAKTAANGERDWRGGKYECEVRETELNKDHKEAIGAIVYVTGEIS